MALDLDRQLTSAQMDENGIPDVVRDFTSPLARSRVGSFDLARPAIENNVKQKITNPIFLSLHSIIVRIGKATITMKIKI